MRCYDTPPLPPSQGFLGMMDPSELGICTVRAGGGIAPGHARMTRRWQRALWLGHRCRWRDGEHQGSAVGGGWV